MSFFTELKRRNVVRVGIAYVVASWLLVQVGDIARESFEAPAWVMKMFITALITGFPIVLIFSWAYEITPEGIKREKDIERGESVTHETARRLNTITMALLIGVLVVIAADRFVLQPPPAAGPATAAIDTAAAPSTPSPELGIKQNSIAVLPFVNMSNDPDQEYFSDGISEELLNLLAKVDGLNVASRTSAFAYKGLNTSIPAIAEELKVRNVLEGSVRKSGNRVRITAQLIDTSNDRHLWSDSYDRDLDDIFKVQDEIANAIVTALKSELGLELAAGEIQVQAVTADMDAYDLYLRGRELAIARQDLFEAVRLLELAVERDPDFARAWATLGMAYFLKTSWNVMAEAESSATIERSRKAATRALEIDDQLALPWAILGMIGRKTTGSVWDYAEAISLISRAIELDPGNATAWLWRGIRYSEAGFIEAAIADIKRCLEVDPAYQNCRRHLAINQWILGDSEAAIDTYTAVARSGFSRNDSVYIPMFFDTGNELSGLMALSFFGTAYPGFPVEAYIQALEHPERDHSDKLPFAQAWLDSAEILPTGIVEHFYLSFNAFERLAPNAMWVNNFLWQPPYDRFRRSPHFQRVLREMNLPALWAKSGLPPQCRQSDDHYDCTSPAELRGLMGATQVSMEAAQ